MRPPNTLLDFKRHPSQNTAARIYVTNASQLLWLHLLNLVLSLSDFFQGHVECGTLHNYFNCKLWRNLRVSHISFMYFNYLCGLWLWVTKCIVFVFMILCSDRASVWPMCCKIAWGSNLTCLIRSDLTFMVAVDLSKQLAVLKTKYGKRKHCLLFKNTFQLKRVIEMLQNQKIPAMLNIYI